MTGVAEIIKQQGWKACQVLRLRKSAAAKEHSHLLSTV